MLETSIKKGSGEMLVLAMLEQQPRHGYEISKLIAERSNGVVSFRAASLYPLLIGMQRRGLITSRWVEKPGQRRRRYYRISAEGKAALAAQRRTWQTFLSAIQRVARLQHA
jgi:transcriptional regulator